MICIMCWDIYSGGELISTIITRQNIIFLYKRECYCLSQQKTFNAFNGISLQIPQLQRQFSLKKGKTHQKAIARISPVATAWGNCNISRKDLKIRLSAEIALWRQDGSQSEDCVVVAG